MLCMLSLTHSSSLCATCRGLIRSCVQLFENMGMGSLSVYTLDFEANFLSSTRYPPSSRCDAPSLITHPAVSLVTVMQLFSLILCSFQCFSSVLLPSLTVLPYFPPSSLTPLSPPSHCDIAVSDLKNASIVSLQSLVYDCLPFLSALYVVLTVYKI